MCETGRFRIYGKCFLNIEKTNTFTLPSNCNTEGYVINLSKEVHPVMSQGGCRMACVYNTHTVLG